MSQFWPQIDFPMQKRFLWRLAILTLGLLSPSAQAFEVAPNGALVQSTCSGGTLPVCGVPIPMPATTSVGNTAEVHVPPALLSDATKSLTFTVQCTDNGYGGAAYALVNVNNISCNAFPCQTSSVRLCDTSIPVDGGTPLGGLVHMTMPGSGQAFTVQCVGKQGGPPSYQISDHSGVACSGPAR